MHTEFAPAERAAPDEVERQIALALESEIVREVLMHMGGLVAILNQQRQIVAFSRAFQEFLGGADPAAILGQRPGEAINCAYSAVCPGGCGTSSYCATCGAVNAIIECQGSGLTAEHKCPIRLNPPPGTQEQKDIVLNVRACPLRFGGGEFVMLFLSDITEAENRCKIESIFYHDALNSLSGIKASYNILKRVEDAAERERFLDVINLLSSQLVKDIKVQRILSGKDGDEPLRLEVRPVSIKQVFEDIRAYFEVKNGRSGTELRTEGPLDSLYLRTDHNLLYRVLMNMLLNASEASGKGDTVRLSANRDGGPLRISVWNRAHIPPAIAQRIFQRHYSTKRGGGRGIGTHSMKYIGEKLLGGKVYFTSTPEAGTTFTLEFPAAVVATI